MSVFELKLIVSAIQVNTYSKATSVKPLNGVTDTTTPAVFDPKIVLDVFRNTHDFIEGSEFRSDRATFEDWISLALSPMCKLSLD